jgi:dihydrolipoamide dehydrogenase
MDRDLVIIGGGPAGYTGAIRARQLGASVTLVEASALGGTCLNHGCIPTRSLLRATEFLEIPRKAKDYGIDFAAPEVDLAKMMARKETVIKTLGGGIGMLMESNGVEVLTGSGKFTSPTEIEVTAADGTVTSLSSPRTVIATGSRATGLSVGGDSVLTTDQALELTEVPEAVVIAGGGAIGLALTTIFARLGASVTIVEESASILPGIDSEIIGLLMRELKRQKVNVVASSTITAIAADSVTVSGPDGEATVAAACVIAAESRTANVEGLGLEAAGVAFADGAITVDDHLVSSVAGIYAAGDIAGEPRLAHVAATQGRMAVENALGKDSPFDSAAVPRCIYGSSEIATVGLSEEAATEQGNNVKVGKFPFAANGLATITGERAGMVKVVSEADYGQILGVHILGPHASELIGEAVLAMRMEATPSEIANAIHIHPALTETVMSAAGEVFGPDGLPGA